MALTEITPQNSPGGAGLLRRSHCLKLKIQRELDSPRANGHDWLQKAGQGDDAKDRIDLCDSLDPNLGRRFESPERRAHPAATTELRREECLGADPRGVRWCTDVRK